MEIFLTLCTETCAHDMETWAPYLGSGVYYTETCAVDTENWGQHTGIPVSNTDTCVYDNIDGSTQKTEIRKSLIGAAACHRKIKNTLPKKSRTLPKMKTTILQSNLFKNEDDFTPNIKMT